MFRSISAIFLHKIMVGNVKVMNPCACVKDSIATLHHVTGEIMVQIHLELDENEMSLSPILSVTTWLTLSATLAGYLV